VGGVLGGYPDGSSSRHARFFPVTFERYISLPFRLGVVLGGILMVPHHYMMKMMMMMLMMLMVMMVTMIFTIKP
jgi:hypothetical protein